MKTININLIGGLDKAPEYNKAVIKKDQLDSGTRILVMIFLVGVVFVFITGFGAWFAAESLSGKNRAELEELKAEQEKLEKKQTELLVFKKNLEKDLEIAKFKTLAKEQIESSFVPWSRILKELAAKVPRNIIISNIDKTSTRRTAGAANRLSISGVVPARAVRSNIKPFTAVSFLILNINEDKNSLLYDAEIKTIQYKEKEGLYEFNVETGIRRELPRHPEYSQ